jgi:hypothetical protein|tara:strand:+ start:830 stop:1090 length:261 start_codon:yes stop_codon:yes gene_type:complete
MNIMKLKIQNTMHQYQLKDTYTFKTTKGNPIEIPAEEWYEICSLPTIENVLFKLKELDIRMDRDLYYKLSLGLDKVEKKEVKENAI